VRHLGERLRSRFLRRLWCEPRRRAVVQAPRILSELCWPAHVRFRGPLCRQRRAACPDPTMGALRSPRLAIPHGVRSQDDQPRAPHLRSSGLGVDATPRAHAPNQGSPRDRRRDRDTTFWLSCKFEFAFSHVDDRWVYQPASSGSPVFHPVPPPDERDVAQIAATVWRKATQKLARLDGKQGVDGTDGIARDEPLLAALASASVAGLIATGHRRGARVLRIGRGPSATNAALTGKQCAAVEGFNSGRSATAPRSPSSLPES
jgi:hypothetical protein